MANLLDAMLAEAEAALATPDRRLLFAGQVHEAAPSESPLPPPTSAFACAGASPPACSTEEATASSDVHSRAPGACSAHKGATSGRADDLASKLARRRQWEHECEPATSDAAAIDGSASAHASPSEHGCGAVSVGSADKARPDAWTRSYGEHAGRGKENQSLPDMEHTLARVPLACGSAVNALSEKEFKEKVDRKIAYFETLARESRLRKEEDAAAEQSLLEARSRIEASAAKRQSMRKSVSSAAWLQEDMEQAQCRLVFGHGCLSLTDLSDDAGSYEAGGEHEEEDLVPTGALAQEEPSAPFVTLTEPAPPNFETASEPQGRKFMVANGTKSVFGISPVLETNTPDVEGISTSSPTFQEQDQQQLFEGSKSRACPEECAEEKHVDSDASAPAENVCAEGSSVSDAAAMRTKTWAGALACPTPTRVSYQSAPAHVLAPHSTLDEHLAVEPGRPRDSDQDHNTLILGRLDSFLGSLRSPYGATPQENLSHERSSSAFSLTDDSREGGMETATLQTVHEAGQNSSAMGSGSQHPPSDASAQAQSVDAGEDMKRQRAADKRAAFLASMNKISGDQPVAAAMTRGCENGAEQEADDKHLLQAVELRAQRLSDIASCDISLSSATCNKSLGSTVQIDSNRSIHRESPVLMTSQDGETGIHSIKVADMVGETSDAKASLGLSNQPFLSQHFSQYVASASKSSDSASSSLHPTDAGLISCPVAHGSSASRATEQSVTNSHEQSAGIGIQVKRVRGLITVVDLMPDGPAAEKLTKGQVVLQIDGEGELRCSNLVRMAHAALTEVVWTKQIVVGCMPHADFWSEWATGLATLPFKSVLAKFRGTPGSTVSLSVVDSAMAFKSGLASRTIEVQRFLAPARTRQQAFSAQASEKAAQDTTASTPPQADTEKRKPLPFAEWPRAELSQDSGLCSPYSDPGDAFSDRKRCAASSRADAADSKEGPARTSGAISIDALHSRLLERLMGSVGSGAVPSAASSQNIDESAISGPVSSVCLATPTHELTPRAADANRNPKRRSSTSAQEQEEKFRCLLATTSFGPSAKPLVSITRTTAVALCSEQGGGPAASFSSRSGEFGKRVRSPNAAQPPTRSDKRMRHEQTTNVSLYSSAPGRVHADESTRSRPSRSTGPRQPAVGTTRRPASAPKSRPESHERNAVCSQTTVGGQPQTAPGPAPGLRKSRLSVTMHAHSSRSLASGSASNPATCNATRNPVRAFSSKGSKTASSSPARNVRAGPVTSLRTRRSEEGGERSGVARQKSLDNSLQVYADVGRAVTSFVQKLYKTPDPNRLPDKEEIIDVLGKLTADRTSVSFDATTRTARLSAHELAHGNLPSAAASTDAATAPGVAVAASTFNQPGKVSQASESHRRKTPVRPSSAHAHRKSEGSQVDKENVGNVSAKKPCGVGEKGGDSELKSGLVRKVARDYSSSDASQTFDAVLKIRFGL